MKYIKFNTYLPLQIELPINMAYQVGVEVTGSSAFRNLYSTACVLQMVYRGRTWPTM